MSDLDKLKQKYEDGGKAEKIKGLTKSLKGEASIGPIPRSKAAEFLGDKVAGAVRSARDAMSAEVPVLGGTVGEWIIGEAPEALEDWSYGFGPVRMGRTDVAGPAGALYGMKADPRILDVVGVGEMAYLPAKAAVKAGTKGMKAAAKRIDDVVNARSSGREELNELSQKYAGGGRVGRFFSAVDKAIETLKQKKGTGEQIQKQIEQTPGVKQEELKYRGLTGIKDMPKTTQEEVKAKAAKKPAPIPKRKVLGAGVDEDWTPNLSKKEKEVLDEIGVEPVINPDDRRMLGFMIRDTGDIADADLLKQMAPDEMGFPVNPETGAIDRDAADAYQVLQNAIRKIDSQFQQDLAKNNPKFSRYSISKGRDQENYREVLISLPEQEAKDLNQIAQETFGKNFGDLGDEEANMVTRLEREQKSAATFTSGHYDTPNILTHFRVSDMEGPSGERVLYVDEIQSDWHQKARDVRKEYIKDQLRLAESDISKRAIEEISQKFGSSEITDQSLKELERVKTRMRQEMKAELDKTVPKEFGYATAEDAAKIKELDSKINRLFLEGPSDEELAAYFQPGKLVKGYGGTDKVLSFNPNPGNEKEWRAFREKARQDLIAENNITGRTLLGGEPRELSTREAAEALGMEETDLLFSDSVFLYPSNAYIEKVVDGTYLAVSGNREKRSASLAELEDWLADDLRGEINYPDIVQQIDREATERANQAVGALSPSDWSVTVIEVDPRTGQPARGAQPRTHTTSPATEMRQQLMDEKRKYGNKVPDAPFKDTWHELAVKEILDLATAEGYDKVAFSPGIEQIKRYEQGLRQAVDEIRFGPTPDGNMAVSAQKGGSTVFSGRVVDGVFADGPAAGKTVREVLGKEVSDQIDDQLPKLSGTAGPGGRQMPEMDAEELLVTHGDQMTDDQINWLQTFIQSWDADVDDTPAGEGVRAQLEEAYGTWLKNNTLAGTDLTAPGLGTIKTENLTIGGEGMKSFYDKRLPDFVRKYGEKEFKAPTSYVDLTYGPTKKGSPSQADIRRILAELDEDADDELMERVHDATFARARRELEAQGLFEGDTPESRQHFDDQIWNLIDDGDIQSQVYEEEALRLARERAAESLGDGRQKIKAFAIDVNPQMREKITTEGQKLFAVPPAIGAVPAAQEVLKQPPAQEQPQDQPEEPQGFSGGGRVGKAMEAAERLLRVLHGSPSKVTPVAERNLDVTTDAEYAVKRGRDKMLGQSGPPMVNKFDIPEGRLLRFEEQYSPEDVALMRRFFRHLPENKAMTGEEIYDAAQGRDFVLEGITKAGGLAGYQRPAAGSGNKGEWFRIVEPDELKRGKKKGGLARAFSKSL